MNKLLFGIQLYCYVTCVDVPISEIYCFQLSQERTGPPWHYFPVICKNTLFLFAHSKYLNRCIAEYEFPLKTLHFTEPFEPKLYLEIENTRFCTCSDVTQYLNLFSPECLHCLSQQPLSNTVQAPYGYPSNATFSNQQKLHTLFCFH